QLVADSEGNLAIQFTHEVGSGVGNARGVYVNGMYGTVSTVYDLQGPGASLSGTAARLSAAINVPYTVKSCPSYASIHPTGIVYEIGTALGRPSYEAGITHTRTITLTSSSILGDTGRWWGRHLYEWLH